MGQSAVLAWLFEGRALSAVRAGSHGTKRTKKMAWALAHVLELPMTWALVMMTGSGPNTGSWHKKPVETSKAKADEARGEGGGRLEVF